VKRILLKNSSLFTIVDDDDFDSVCNFKWRTIGRGVNNLLYYAQAYVDGKTVRLHRLILNPLPHEIIDHRDGNGLNNQRSNLRLCTQYQNLLNMRSHAKSSSVYKGVSWSKVLKKWVAFGNLNGKQKGIGSFDSEFDAAMAYDDFVLKNHGEFARLNYPEQDYVFEVNRDWQENLLGV